MLFEVPDAKTGGPDLPAVMGMPRPELARILADRAAEVGVKLRLGTTFTELAQDEDGVDVTFSDGSTGLYLASVPEPASLGLLCGAALPALRRRRTRPAD